MKSALARQQWGNASKQDQTHLLLFVVHRRPSLSPFLAQPDLHIPLGNPLLLGLLLQPLVLPQLAHESEKAADRPLGFSFLLRVPDVVTQLATVSGRSGKVGVQERAREDRVETGEVGCGEGVVVSQVAGFVGFLCGFTLLHVGL